MTLTKVAKITRVVILLSIISIFIGVSTYIGYKIWYARYLASLPPVEEKPDPKFGVLKPPSFPSSSVSSSNFSYTIATTTGNLPELGKIAKVFIMPPTTASFLAGEKGQSLAQKFNLDPNPQIITDSKYKFQNPDATLTLNLDSGNFIYQKESTKAATEKIQDDDNQLINSFKVFLKALGLLNDQIKNGPARVVFLDQDKQKARLSLWPEDIDKKPVLTSYQDKSLINTEITKSSNELSNYLLLEFTYWPVDTASFATYPIKPTKQAFDELRSGQGVIIVAPTNTEVPITEVTLAYFQSDEYSPYLQPIYVFNGPNFTAYVTAITNSYLELTK